MLQAFEPEPPACRASVQPTILSLSLPLILSPPSCSPKLFLIRFDGCFHEILP